MWKKEEETWKKFKELWDKTVTDNKEANKGDMDEATYVKLIQAWSAGWEK